MLVKSRSGNSRSENVFSSCAEESVSAVRHIGVQHDGFLIADVAEAEVYHGTSIEQSKDVCSLVVYVPFLICSCFPFLKITNHSVCLHSTLFRFS